MQGHWLWWGLAVLLGVLELMTGTFYLLVLGIGIAAGGVLAFAGAGLAWQFLAAAVVSGVGWFLLRRFNPRRGGAPVQHNRDVHLDIGERVRVEHWLAPRRAQVQYRGAAWTAELAPDEPDAPAPGEFEIRSMDGNRLIVARPRQAARPS